MESCTLNYIPLRLHSLGKNLIDEFSVGEELYYRCKPEDNIEPYKSTPLYDISHNRNFNDSITYPKDDVLFNIDVNKGIETISDREIVTIVIKQLHNNTFEKNIESLNDAELTAKIKLLHDPVPCMYSHSVFEISINDTVVTRENYDELLNRNGKIFKNLRRDIRHELTAILFSKIVDSDAEAEIITDL